MSTSGMSPSTIGFASLTSMETGLSRKGTAPTRMTAASVEEEIFLVRAVLTRPSSSIRAEEEERSMCEEAEKSMPSSYRKKRKVLIFL